MRLKEYFTVGAVALLGAAPLKATAQTWTTVLDYQLVPGNTAGGTAITADSFGNVFVGGDGADAAGIFHGLVLSAASPITTSTTWFKSDDYDPNDALAESIVTSMGVDAADNVYSAGYLALVSSGPLRWYVRTSSDSGLTWSTLDDYQYASGYSSAAEGVASDNAGDLYVVGYGEAAYRGKNRSHWLVRRRIGQKWSLVDDFVSGGNGESAWAVSCVPGLGVFVVGDRWIVRHSSTGDPGTWETVDGPFSFHGTSDLATAVGSDGQGNIYVAGLMGTSSANGWATRVSHDDGITWSTEDYYTYKNGARPLGFGTDLGDPVVVGRAWDGQSAHWIVRRLGTSGWQTVDDFQLAAGHDAMAYSATTDANGDFLVAGFARDVNGAGHWIIRRLNP